ncbi:sphingosine-1-phosphate lyase 1-like [Symsagittifera roscoffensis]|uniref:sphingosine-1-phosphate lyase 1-like n=1 Tax=Symsagittifera roscoffensis TaxID=84072 RepID=UPI00307C8142
MENISSNPYVEGGLLYVESSLKVVEDKLSSYERWQVAVATCLMSVLVTYIYCWITQFIREGYEVSSVRVTKWMFKTLRSLPIVKGKVKEKIEEVRHDINTTSFRLKTDMVYMTELPKGGMTVDQVMDKLKHYNTLDEHVDKKLSGQVYQNNEEIVDLTAKVFRLHGYTNPLHADVFQDIRKIEAETAKFVCSMFHGDEESHGVITTGGSESLLLAVLAARNRAYDRGIRYPELVMSVTAHAALDKACFYFRVKAVHVPINSKTFKLDFAKMKRAVNKNTCLIVGSFPEFPYGLMDPIEKIAALGVARDIPVHVDACLGGFVVAFMAQSGLELPPFDFAVPGVMSISCDNHKYGFAPKGTSALVFRSPEYMQCMYFSQPDWPGGIYATPTTGGSRSGGIIATAWATMLYMGEEGYTKTAAQVVHTTRALAKGISETPGLCVMGDPQICVVSWTSYQFDIWRQFELLTKRKWFLGTTQFPGGIHFTVTMKHVEQEWLDSFLKDIRETAEICMQSPEEKANGQAAMYGMSQTIPDRSLIKEMTYMFWDRYYSTATD